MINKNRLILIPFSFRNLQACHGPYQNTAQIPCKVAVSLGRQLRAGLALYFTLLYNKQLAMQTGVDIGFKAIMLTLLLCCGVLAMAQIKDTTVIIGTTDQYATAPVARAGKPFYDLFNPNAKGFRPTALYSSEDQLYVGVHYNAFCDNWSPDLWLNK